MELLDRLRRAVKKLTFLLYLKKFLINSTWQLAALIRSRTLAITGIHHLGRRAYSFSDRPGLRACVEVVVVDRYTSTDDDDDDDDSAYEAEEEDNGRRSEGSSGTSSSPTLRRVTSYPLVVVDVDECAEEFFHNFYRHLLYEKQVSLELRYCRSGSSTCTSSDTIVSPLSSVGSQFVSPSSSVCSQFVSPT